MSAPSAPNSVLWNPALNQAKQIPTDHAAFLQSVQDTPEPGWLVYIQLLKSTVDQAKVELQTITDQHLAQVNELNLDLDATRKLYLDAQKKLDWYESHGTQSAKVQLSEKIADVSPFEGTRSDIDPFLTRLRLKLNGNADRYPTESSRVQYAVGRLAGKAEQLVQLHIDRDTGVIEFLSLKEFSDWIISEFEDPDKMRNAQVELQGLRQKNREFSTYYSEFAPLMLKTGFNDEGKTAALMNGISRELRAAMAVRDTPPTFAELVKDLHKVDGRLRANDAFNNRSGQSNSANTRNPSRLQQQQQRAAPSNPSRPASAPPVAPVTIALPPVEVMDTTAGAGRGPISPAERERRIRENLCTYCGARGHYRKNCPTKPTSRLRAIGWHDHDHDYEHCHNTPTVETPSEAGN